MGINSSTDVTGAAAIAALGYIAFSDTIPAIQISLHVHACGLFANARVRCWGINYEQQLGDGIDGNENRGTSGYPISGAVFATFNPTINTVPILNVAVGR